MTRDADRPKTVPIPELADIVMARPDGVYAGPRFVQHEGRVYDLSKKFDQNCVKMHAQRLHRKRRLAISVKKAMTPKLNRKARRIKAARGSEE